MRIEKLFQKDVFRSINGVVKADQLDESSVWQELDEFVITRELDRHLQTFFSNYINVLDNPQDPDISGRIGVWVSGFFGSGKSHFIKVLSYLLENREHTYDGECKRAVAFFESKIKDAMFLGDIKRAVASNADVILFNIDSKADNRSGRDAILHVFLKVLNEAQGYSPDYPHIAHMERYLDGKGKLTAFQEAYERETSVPWTEDRDAYEFNRDYVLDALTEALGQSRDSMEKWLDNAENNLPLSIENFCKWTKEYLDTKGPDHRIVFLVDEVGQFIGGDTHLMLNLQTIVEDLGTACGGRAWVVVTSQEDIDQVLGTAKSTSNDFSKIQGRFVTRLSLSSANVDEVIRERLLAKNGDATQELTDLFADKGDIVKNQLTFSNIGITFKQITDAEDFAGNYPFAPYQFKLLQRIFESIRKVGATGLHLAQGERSLLDAFQSAAKQVANDDVGVLVPLYRFYPSIESFLESTVKRTIDHAAENPSLEPFDVEILRVLFLIRYVDEMKGNVDNLVTLCVDRIDADRLDLRRRIEEGLNRLESQTLISRSGDIYLFLTNEERDVSREIKGVELNASDEAKLLGTILFDDVLKEQRKHRFIDNNMDFAFNRVCDAFPTGNRTEGALAVSVISPLHDDYELYQDGRCVLESGQENGQVLIRLGNDDTLGRELRAYLQTEKYVRTKDDSTLPPSTRIIIRHLSDDNRQRRDRLVMVLSDMLTNAVYFVAGARFTPKGSSPQFVVGEALNHLIRNTFSKMGLLPHLNDNPAQEIQAVLRSNDVVQQTLNITLPENNPNAIADLRSYIDLCTKTSRQIVLHDMIQTRYTMRPYGWPELEVALLLARLVVLGEIHLVSSGDVVPPAKLYDTLTTPNLWRKTQVVQRKTADPAAIQKARNLAKDVFGEMAPDGEDPLADFLRERLSRWQADLQPWKSLTDTGGYPGDAPIGEGLGIAKALLSAKDNRTLVEQFNAQENDLRDFSDDYADLTNFYTHQRPTWDKLRKAKEGYNLNAWQLEQDPDAASALKGIDRVLEAIAPYGLIQEADGLITKVDQANTALIDASRASVAAQIDGFIAQAEKELDSAGANAALRTACIAPLEAQKAHVGKTSSIAHISQAGQEAEALLDAAVRRIEDAMSVPPPPEQTGGGTPPPAPTIKKSRTIRPSEAATKTYLETRDDVDEYLDALRKQLEEVIDNHERVRIK